MKSKFKKKRLIFFLPNFSLGGASESIFKLSKFLKKYNFSILIISLGKNFYKKEFKKINCDVFEINSSKAIFSIFEIRRKIIEETNKKFYKTIFISNIHYANIISIFSLVNLKKVKIVLTERSSISELKNDDNLIKKFKNIIIYFLTKFLYRFADLIITNSKYEKEYIQKEFTIKKIVCIHPPSINKINKEINRNSKIKKKMNIIFVGSLNKEKRIILILKALKEIKSKIKFKLSIFGNGPEKKNINDFISSNNLKNKVFLMGHEKNKIKIFKNANLFINASLFEGLPNALVQAINYNVFPICSNAPGGNIEVIDNGKFGMSFKLDDKDDLKRKIQMFFDRKLRLNNKTRINHLKMFTEKKSNENYLKVLNKL
tara:strand:- start:777 stop:1895 length:1119 start_codon:yes stop_codon:yes gene_type:complete